jgi:hypothetical protein
MSSISPTPQGEVGQSHSSRGGYHAPSQAKLLLLPACAATSPPSLPKPPLLVPPTPSSLQAQHSSSSVGEREQFRRKFRRARNVRNHFRPGICYAVTRDCYAVTRTLCAARLKSCVAPARPRRAPWAVRVSFLSCLGTVSYQIHVRILMYPECILSVS